MSDISKDDYRFLPVAEATSPTKGGCFLHYVDHWWTVHPEHGLLFYNRKMQNGRRWQRGLGSPQCNTDQRIVRKVGLDTAGSVWPEIEIRLLPSVWVPIDISDYR